jgi:hypothetical protein
VVNLANQYTATVTYNAFAAQAVAVTPTPTPTPKVLPISAPSTVHVPAPVSAIAPTSVVKQATTATAAPVAAIAATQKPVTNEESSVASAEKSIVTKAAITSAATNTRAVNSVSAMPTAPSMQVPSLLVTNETTTLEVLHKWANKVGYQLIVNGQIAGKQFPGIHPVAYVDLPLLPAHKTISARSVTEGSTALSKVYSDAKVNLNGIEFDIGVVDSRKTIEVKAIQERVAVPVSLGNASPNTATGLRRYVLLPNDKTVEGAFVRWAAESKLGKQVVWRATRKPPLDAYGEIEADSPVAAMTMVAASFENSRYPFVIEEYDNVIVVTPKLTARLNAD